MPTGYTAAVANGTVTDFRTFALHCARAFGACIAQRDDPSDDLPKYREPPAYHAREREAADARVKELLAMSAADADRAADEAYTREMSSWSAYVAEREAERRRYEAMLAHVRAWEPPTKEHAGLKTFMIEQLEMSLPDARYEPAAPQRLAGAEWYKRECERATKRLARATESEAEEQIRCAGANAWIKALYDSLPARPEETSDAD